MNIAIVDDEKIEIKLTVNYLKNYIQKNYPEIEKSVNIETFSCAKDLLKNFTPGKYDLLIMDICMIEIDGIQTAKIIRERGDTDVNIIFLTGSDNYILDGYKVFAVGYFLKPLAEHAEEFAKTFEHLFQKLCKGRKEIIFPISGAEIPVPYRNLCYVDIDDKHRLCVHLPNKILSTSMTYSDCQNILADEPRFLECYHRIIVNMDFIKSMENDYFILKDDVLIPISQRKKKEVKAKYIHYLAQK